MNLKDNNKINFIIDLFLDMEQFISGGIIAMHKLAYELANEGHNVYIFCKPGYPHPNITQIPGEIKTLEGHRFISSHEPFSYPLGKTVSIYPEHSVGSRFNTIHNVRWIMYHTTLENENNFKENDYIFNYGSFKTLNIKEDGKLTVKDYNLDKFFIENNTNRKGYCFINQKQTPSNYQDIISEFSPIDITSYKNQTDLNLLRKEFNKYEYFITFDQKTYLTTAASLCGCKVIILNPNEDLTPIEYKLENPTKMFGIAYGIDDLQWAKDTIHLVRNYITQFKDKDKKTVRNFIKFWEEKINYG